MFKQPSFIKLVVTQFLVVLILSVTATAQNQQAKAGAQYHLNRGTGYAAQEKWLRAIAEYDQALVMDAKDATAYDARGRAWLALEDFGMALRDFNQAMKLAPENVKFYLHRGQALQGKGKKREAESDFARSRELTLQQYAAQRLQRR